MITNSNLSFLISQKIKDAGALLKAGRNSSAVYIMGYALEIALKRKICSTWGFANGFPETAAELQTYIAIINRTNSLLVIRLNRVTDIRNHNLNRLLYYSGAEVRIKQHFLNEWLVVSTWDPESRYKVQRFTRAKARSYIDGCNTIIKEIL